MKSTEIEAKFLAVDIDTIRRKLHTLDAVCVHPMRGMRRVTIDTLDMKRKDAFLRVRDEGDRVTMTYKEFSKIAVDGAREIEVEVSDFDKTVALLDESGLIHSSYQESRRETWQLGEVDIVIDEWPWLKPYIEIEAENEQAVRDIAEKLGFLWEHAVFGDVMFAYYAEYDHLKVGDTIGNVPYVRFGDPLPDLLRP